MKISVNTLLDDGSKTSDTVNGKPCVQVGFTWEISEGNFETRMIKLTLGEIDTGAQGVVIDAEFAGLEGRAPLRQTMMVTANGGSLADIYVGTLLFFGPNGQVLSHKTDFVTRGFSAHASKILLGRSFLRNTAFCYNRDRGIESIEIS